MMSQAKIHIVESAYAAFGRGDVAVVLDLLTDEASWGMVGREEDIPFAGIRQDRAGAAEFFKRLGETKEIAHFEPQEYLAAEDKVLVWGRYDWTMRRNGVKGASQWLHVFTIRGGRIAARRGHQDTAMLAQAYHAAPAAKRVATG